MESIGRTQTRILGRRSSLDAMGEEIENQIGDLPAFANELRRHRGYKGLDPSRMIFTGSGDSFAAAQFAQALSRGRAIATDPYELYLNLDRTRGKTLFLVSVGGRSITNVKLARQVRRLAEKRVAITANPTSPVAKACDDIIPLRYRSSGILTSGSVGFTSSLLAVASLTARLPRVLDLKAMEKRAAEWWKEVKSARGGPYVFIGSGIGYALAAYGSFKIHEVLGLRAEYQYSEQFGHAQLFSIRKTSDNVICIALGSDGKTAEIFRALFRDGFRAHLIGSENSDPVSAGLEVAFHMQHLALGLARKMRLRECAFLMDKKRLRLSSRLIY